MKVASLQIKVTSDQVEKATRRLDALETSGRRAERATDGLKGMFAKTAIAATATGVALGAIGLGLAGLYKIVQITKDFGVLNGMLKTATGSAEGAAIAFKGVQAFAANTPYDLQQATTAFIKLVNYGLTPSTEALTAYGDFATSMGKPLLQMVEAVADATSGEMERLKEFGVKAKQEGDKVAFTFRGITETVGRNSEEIEGYLIRLSQKNFGGAMAEQMAELGGVMANIGDAWDTIFLNISKQGVGDIITKAFRTALEALNEINAQLASGQTAKLIDAQAHLWGNLYDGLTAAAKAVTPRLATESGLWGDDVEEVVEIAKKTFEYFPVIVGTSIKLASATFNILPRAGQIAMKTAVDLMGNELERLVTNAESAAERTAAILQGNFNPAIFDFADTVNKETFDNKGAAIITEGGTALQGLITETAETTKKALKDAELSVLNYEFDKASAEKLRKEFDAIKPGDDKLGGFRVRKGPSSDTDPAGGGSGGGGKNELDSLIDSLRSEEEAITASYDERMLIVERYTAAGSEQRALLSEQILTATGEEMLKLAEMRASDFEGQVNAFTLIEESLAASYQKRREIILENTAITEDQRLALLTKAETAYTAQVRKLEATRNKAVLDGTLQFFNDVASIGSAFGEKGFKIAKAAAIAGATISMWNSAQTAYDNGQKAGGAYYGNVLGAVWAAGAIASGTANIAKIASTQYTAYEHGGMIPSGETGIVGEAGAELITGPAIVRSARSTADMGNKGASASPVIVNVYNLPGQEVETRQSTGPNGEQQIELIVKKVEQKLTGDAINGGGQFVPAMAKAFHLSRA